MEYSLFDDFSALSAEERRGWCTKIYRITESAFRNYDNNRCLLGNLLVLERYLHTLEQGLASRGEAPLSPGLCHGVDLLWDCLENRTSPLEFQDFANDLDACVFANNVGDEEDAPREFWDRYIGDDPPRSAYEWLALEWTAWLLMQLVSVAGGRVDDPDKEGVTQVEFYGVCNMLDILEDACTALTGNPIPPLAPMKETREIMERVHSSRLFQQIIREIQSDLKIAQTATPDQYSLFREQYRQHTIIPEQYAKALLDY